MRCPQTANVAERSICPPGLHPIFVPNINAQRKAEKAIVVCKDVIGKAFELDEKCQVVCADGQEPDPCLGCMDRQVMRCHDPKIPICPDATKPVVLTVPYQCDWPYRCDPITDTSRYSVKAEPCDLEQNQFSIPLCASDPELPPDTCLQCQDGIITPTCIGMCPKDYFPTPIPHFYCNNAHEKSLNQIQHWDRNEFFLFNENKENTNLPKEHPRFKEDLVTIQDVANLDLDENVKLVPDYENFGCFNYTSGRVSPMLNPCDKYAFPVCADGKPVDPCLGCGPASHYTCPDTEVEICPNGTVLVSVVPTPEYCKYEVSCEDPDNPEELVEPNCEYNEPPLCLTNGTIWSMHFCGCGPDANMICMGKEGPGTKLRSFSAKYH